MEYKSREKIPIYGSILMILGCILILGILPCIPLCFWVYYNNRYVVAFESKDTVLIEKYNKYIRRAKISMIVVTVISVIIEAVTIVQVILSIVDKINGTECEPCSMRG